MDGFLLILFLLSFIGFILGLISPKIVIYWGKKTRGQVLLFYGIATLVFFISFGLVSPSDSTKNSRSNEAIKADENVEEVTANTAIGKLQIIDTIYENSKVKITGKTDLPDGSSITVDFDVAGRSGSDTYIGVDTKVTVKNGEFYAEITPPNRSEYEKGPYMVEAMFTPRAQTDDILKIVGKNGENLTGENASESFGFKILVTTKEVNLKLDIDSNYPMVRADDYSIGSPERALSEFLLSWKNKDWTRMVKYTQITWRSNEKNPKEVLDAWFGFKDLIGAKITHKSEGNNVTVDIAAEIYYTIGANVETKKITARIIREKEPYKPSADGDWGINPISILKED